MVADSCKIDEHIMSDELIICRVSDEFPADTDSSSEALHDRPQRMAIWGVVSGLHLLVFILNV